MAKKSKPPVNTKHFFRAGRTTVCLSITDYGVGDMVHVAHGLATRHPDDPQIPEVGKALAAERASKSARTHVYRGTDPWRLALGVLAIAGVPVEDLKYFVDAKFVADCGGEYEVWPNRDLMRAGMMRVEHWKPVAPSTEAVSSPRADANVTQVASMWQEE